MALEKLTMPQLGESVTEGTINSWLVKVGDHVNKYDPIADIMTDKVNAEVPTFFSGTIKEIVTSEGETIGVGDVMCYIETKSTPANHTEQKEVRSSAEQTGTSTEENKVNDQSMKKRYSPAVLRMAQENNIDLSKVD